MPKDLKERRKSRQGDYSDDEYFETPKQNQHGVSSMLQMTAELVPTFSGRDKTYPVTRWIEDVESNAEIYGWSALQQLLVARRSLRGTAELWLRAERPYKSWEELKTALTKEFPDLVDSKAIHEIMSVRKKRANESCLDYMLVMKELGRRGKMPDYVAIKYIVDGIVDYEANKIMLYGVTTYTDLKEKLKIYATVSSKMAAQATTSGRSARNVTNKVQSGYQTRCYGCGELGHSSSNCPHRSKGVKCFRCNEFGHIGKACTNITENSLNASKMAGTAIHDRKSSGDFGRPRSYNQSTKRAMFNTIDSAPCNQLAHYNDESAMSSQDYQHAKQGTTYDAANFTGDNSAPSGSFENRNTIECQDYQHVKRTMFGAATANGDHRASDGGATSGNLRKCDGQEFVYNRELSKSMDSVEKKPMVSLRLDNLNVQALIDSGSDINIISTNVLNEISECICEKDNLQITGIGKSVVNSLGKCRLSVYIDGKCYKNVLFHILCKDKIPYDVILGQDFLNNITVMLKGGSVCILDKELSQMGCYASEVCLFDFVLGYMSSTALKDEVLQCVQKYRPKQTKEAPLQLKVVLKDDVPVASRPRRLALKEQEIVEAQVTEWLSKGIIRVSYSDYCSPLVLVKKKDGSTRVCVDYRNLNKKIVKDEFPLPVIEDLIDKLKDATIFSVLDLKNGFFHLKINEDSVKYTSFVTHNGQFEFLRAPFGLSVCPKYFMRFISVIFRDLMAKGEVIIFIDDILIPAQTEAQAVKRLKNVLMIAELYGLEINWKKAKLICREIEYLGHSIRNGEVRPTADKTDAVIRYPTPTSVPQLRSFLGLTSYFRKYIKDYAYLAKPLSDLLKKDVLFVFGDKEKAAFNDLKRKLGESPVLKIFDSKLPTELHTDASSIAYSGILLQLHSSGWHPVYYMSKKTSEAEAKYSSYELEALAIIESVRKFRVYLYGIHFKIVTDCQAFQQTLKKRELSPKVARWVLYLDQFDFKIEHRPGIKLKHADALSRNPCMMIISNNLRDQIREAQQNDDGLKAVCQILQEKPYADYWLDNDLLYKGEQKLLVIPKSLEKEIIKRVHSNGHFAVKKMKELINKDYYMTDLEKKLKDFMTTCIPCLLATKKAGKQEGYLNPLEKENLPLHTLHVDHVGPLTDTRKQYNHILTIVDAFTKFVWIFPTKSTTTKETIDKLRIHQQQFGNPNRIISDKGTAFTSTEFKEYCQEENIQHVTITTGVPRGNGQVERLHRTIIAVLTKLCIENPSLWYRHVSRVQRALNSTFQRSISTTPFQLMIGTKMKTKEDLLIVELLNQEEIGQFNESREEIRAKAKEEILKIQEENKKTYDKNRKPSFKYREGDLVAIKRTQFGPGLKLKPKFLGPYRIVKVKRNDRYDVEKVDATSEGPNKTSSAADLMKRWPEYDEENID